MTRYARFEVNLRFNLYGQIMQALLPLIFIPFILTRHLGQRIHALYSLMGVLTAQLNLLNFGTTEATVKYLAELDAARKVRGGVLEMCQRAGTPHLGSSLSCADILVAAFRAGKVKDPADFRYHNVQVMRRLCAAR